MINVFDNLFNKRFYITFLCYNIHDGGRLGLQTRESI